MGFSDRQHWVTLGELVPADLLAEMQSRVALDTYAVRLDFVSRRVSHRRTLAQMAKAPLQVDASGGRAHGGNVCPDLLSPA